jgi:hypothetical protein
LIVAEFDLPRLRVKALQPKRRRAGLEFTSTPSDLTVGMLGTGLGAVMGLAAILADPLLAVTVIENEAERPVTDDERDQLTAFLEAEVSKVDPDAPPTPDAEAHGSDASGGAAADPSPAEPAAAPAAPAPADPAKPARAARSQRTT